MYVNPNFPTKSKLRMALSNGETVTVFSPGPFPSPQDGIVYVEGPHYPKPHTWYATVVVVNGKVTKIKS